MKRGSLGYLFLSATLFTGLLVQPEARAIGATVGGGGAFGGGTAMGGAIGAGFGGGAITGGAIGAGMGVTMRAGAPPGGGVPFGNAPIGTGRTPASIISNTRFPFFNQNGFIFAPGLAGTGGFFPGGSGGEFASPLFVPGASPFDVNVVGSEEILTPSAMPEVMDVRSVLQNGEMVGRVSSPMIVNYSWPSSGTRGHMKLASQHNRSFARMMHHKVNKRVLKRKKVEFGS